MASLPHEELVQKNGKNFTLRRIEFNKQENFYYISLLSTWFSAAQEAEVFPTSFFEDLSDGVIICRVLAEIKGSGVTRSDYHDPVSSQMAARENLKLFRDLAREKFNFPAVAKVEDFHDENPSIIATLLFLAKIAYKNPNLRSAMPKALRQHVKAMPELIPDSCWEKFVASFWNALGYEEEDDGDDTDDGPELPPNMLNLEAQEKKDTPTAFLDTLTENPSVKEDDDFAEVEDDNGTDKELDAQVNAFLDM
mmetsp:Transcript_15327/g.17350  ORF Transcript_15327/g.17350 Transcript_15327/m.17350 type:complete len:251 (+) Transcript_15327:111-863(+)|eukprot:CAMPEP_0184042544 /NCGR_PEP_ID=MMETSP0955-20130417/66406_1 /TAXON_ID=627963 /ORGANISM="Aplanochytrium sp, Strain PBS07" /LENGTH=250 /DNA_ID=CAMNT_0026333315 /DNA_START=62 /DNA_END=817 /DNA_ORIENTATION=-